MKQLKRITLVIFCSVFHTTALAEELPTLDFNGNIMIDYDNFSAGFLEKSDDAADDLYLRRLSLGLESYFYQDWFANVDIDVSDGVELKDAYVKYTGWKKIAEFTLGKQKEPFGLEQLMSSKNLLMIERSMATNALAPERAYGIKSSGGTDVGVAIGTINWQLGYFQNHLQNHLLDDDEEKTTAITGKITWAPWQQNNNVLHLGASFSERDLNGELFKGLEPPF